MKHKNPLRIILPLLLVITVLLLPGCKIEIGVTDDKEADVPAETTGGYAGGEVEGTLDLFLLKAYDRKNTRDYYEYNTQYAFFAGIIDLYKKARPGITVNLTEFDNPDSYLRELMIKVKTSRGPDVIFLSHSLFHADYFNLAREGWFEDLNPYIENDASDSALVLSEYCEPLLDAYTVGRNRMAVPLDMNISGFLMSKETLELSGITPPENGLDIDALFDMLSVFPGKMSLPENTGYAELSGGFSNFVNLSGRWWNADKMTADFKSDEFLQLLNQYMEFNAQHSGYNNIQVETLAQYKQFLQSHSLLLMQADSYSSLKMSYILFDAFCDQTPLFVPASADGGYTASAEDYAAINKNSDNKPLAYDFIKFCLNEGQPLITAYHFPVQKSAFIGMADRFKNEITNKQAMFSMTQSSGNSSASEINQIVAADIHEEFFSALVSVADGITNGCIPSSQINNYVNSAMRAVTREGTPVETAAADLQKKVESFLKSGSDRQ